MPIITSLHPKTLAQLGLEHTDFIISNRALTLEVCMMILCPKILAISCSTEIHDYSLGYSQETLT